MLKIKEMKPSTKVVSLQNLAFIDDDKAVQMNTIKEYRNSVTDNITLNKKNSNNSKLNNARIEDSNIEIKDHLPNNHLKVTDVSRFNKDKIIENEKIVFKKSPSIQNDFSDNDILSGKEDYKKSKTDNLNIIRYTNRSKNSYELNGNTRSKLKVKSVNCRCCIF